MSPDYVHTEGSAIGVRLPLEEQGQPVMDGESVSSSWVPRVLLFGVILCLAHSGACTPYIGTTYKSFIRQARENPDPNIRYIAYAKLGSPSLYEDKVQKDEAVRIMVAKLEEGREPTAIRAAIIRSLGNLGDRRARAAILRGVSDTDNGMIRVEACRALGKVGLPEDGTTLARIMMVDKLEDCRIAAIEAIGSLKSPEPRIYQILIEGMDHEDPAIRYQCLQSLRTITEKDYGVDPAAWRRELQPILAGTAPDAAAKVGAKAAASEKKVASKTILGPN
jgi:HEAT repeat protein